MPVETITGQGFPHTRKELEELQESLTKRNLLTLEGIKAFARDNSDLASTAVASLITGYAAYHISNQISNKVSNQTSTQSMPEIINSVITTFVTSFIKQSIESIRTGRRTETDVYRDMHEFLKKTSDGYVKTLDDELRLYIDRLDRQIQMELEPGPRGPFRTSVWDMFEHRQIIVLAIANPHRVNLSHSLEGDDATLDRLLTQYTQELRQKLPEAQWELVRQVVTEWRAASVAAEPQRVQVALLGPPGVGKTRLIGLIDEEIFKRAGVSIPRIRLVTSSDKYAFATRPDSFPHPGGPLEKSIEEFQLAYLISGVRNPMVEIDEGAHYLTKNHPHIETTLRILDKENKTLRIRAHDLDIRNFDSALLIFTGNQKIEDLHEAVLSRVTVKEFPPLKREERIPALEKAIGQALSEMRRIRFSDDQQKAQIEAQIIGLKDFILDEDVERNQGAREIQGVAKQTVQYLTERAREGVPFDENDAKTRIKSLFTGAAVPALEKQPGFGQQADEQLVMSTWPVAPQRVDAISPQGGYNLESELLRRADLMAGVQEEIARLCGLQKRGEQFDSAIKAQLKRVSQVRLDMNYFPGDKRRDVLDALAASENIKQLELTASRNSDELPHLIEVLQKIDAMPHLDSIVLHANRSGLNDSHANKLAELNHLTRLHANYNEVTAAGATALASSSCSFIYLRGNKVSAEAAKTLDTRKIQVDSPTLTRLLETLQENSGMERCTGHERRVGRRMSLP